MKKLWLINPSPNSSTQFEPYWVLYDDETRIGVVSATEAGALIESGEVVKAEGSIDG